MTQRVMLLRVALFALVCLAVCARRIHAAEQVPQVSDSARIAAVESSEGGSPRDVVLAYSDLCRVGDFVEAARFLDLPKERNSDGPRLARQLKAVLDRNHWIEPDELSPLPAGNTQDGLSLQFEQIARIRGPLGIDEPVRLYRRGPNPDGPQWVFSRRTVERIDAWYDDLEMRWAQDRLPNWLLRPGPKELLLWQWGALASTFGIAWPLAMLLSKITRRVLARLAQKTSNAWDDAIVLRLGGPLTALWILALLYLTIPFLALYQPAGLFLDNVLRGALYFVGFWIASRVIDVSGHVVGESGWATEHSVARSLVPIAVRLGKIVVLAFAVVALVSALGYPVTSLIAGLGVGGLAVALAAQKTVENLLGAFALGLDQPFRVGDFIKVEELVGNVESIGLRSTKIRTLDRTLVTIANGKLSEVRIENFGARDRMRLYCTLGLVYNTSVHAMRMVLTDLEQVLRAHPMIWPDAIVVRFKEFGDSALNIEVMAWFKTTDFSEFQRIREEILLGFMVAVEQAGASFAFPTRTVHLVQNVTEIAKH